MDPDYYKENHGNEKYQKGEMYSELGKADWDISDTYLENTSITNYGRLNEIECISREVFYDDSGVAKAKYTYEFFPADFIVYCENLAKFGSLDTRSVDSNALFLECTHIRRNANIHIYVDLVERTISVDFEKTNASDL